LNYLTLGVCVVEIGFDPETGLNPVLDSGGGGERYGNIQPRMVKNNPRSLLH